MEGRGWESGLTLERVRRSGGLGCMVQGLGFRDWGLGLRQVKSLVLGVE